MGNNLTPVKTSNSRVFLIEGRARPDHIPSYQSCLRMMGVTQGFGDIERIENPDPNQYGKWIEIGEIRGATERVTTQLEGRYALNLKSVLMDLALKTCASDIHLHLGQCTDPSDFNVFEKAVILEQAYLTSYNTEDFGALQSGDEAAVNETVDVSARKVYEVMPLSFGSVAGSIVTNEIIDVKICDTPSCGTCNSESDGCKKIYALSLSAGGSPSTPADVIFSPDGGTTWYAYDVNSLGAAEDPTGIACLGEYVVVVSNASNSLHYALKSEFEDLLVAPTFTEVATGFVSGGEPNAIFVIDDVAYIVGDNGYVYVTEDPTAGVEVLDAGTVTVDVLNDVHAFSTDIIVAVGNNGAVIYSENGTTFAAATRPVGLLVNLTCVFVKNASEWWVGTSAGRLYYTLNGGSSWHEKAFAGNGAGVVRDIEFATDSIAYLSHSTATPRGRIFRSYDGGQSWKLTPERTGASLPLSDRVTAMAVCPQNPNFVVAGGLNDNGADGIMMVGLA